MKIILPIVSSLFFLALAAAEDAPAPTLKDFAANYEQKCHEDHAAKLARLALKDPTPPSEPDEIRNRSLEKAKCQCMAEKIRGVIDASVAHAILTKDSAGSGPFYLRAYQECMVVAARETMLPLCLAEAKTTKNSTKAAGTCRCIADAAEKIDDQTFINESIATFRSYEQRAKDPKTPLFKGKLATIEVECQAKAGN
ncbi:MAG: hypothetical protein ACRET4_01770 [Steroidobacteraceae bacterium]